MTEAQNLPSDITEPAGPFASLEDVRPALGKSTHMVVVGGSDLTDAVLGAAGISVSRCAGPGMIASAFAAAGDPPTVVLAPLLALTFDILDVITALSALSFGGQLLAVSPALPDAGAVLRELRAEAKGFRLDLLQVGG